MSHEKPKGARLAAQAESERLRREHDSQLSAAQAEADRLKAENDARTIAAQAEADRLKGENDLRTASAASEADRLKRENDAQTANFQADLDRAAKEKTQAEAEKTELRVQLLRQFNVILDTRDTARGLIVNMSDVLFDTAKYSLRAGAREKLARVAGIISGHPGLKLDVEGHTDSVGGDDYNQQLPEQRAGRARLPDRGGNSSEFRYGKGLRKNPACGLKRDDGSPAESARGTGCIGRHNWRRSERQSLPSKP